MEDSTLTVRVISCSQIQATDVVPMDYGGTSDLYCILE